MALVPIRPRNEADVERFNRDIEDMLAFPEKWNQEKKHNVSNEKTVKIDYDTLSKDELLKLCAERGFEVEANSRISKLKKLLSQ